MILIKLIILIILIILITNKLFYTQIIKKPTSFNEKLIYKMKYDRRKILTLWADKLLVKDYINKKGVNVAKLLEYTDKPETIDLKKLPNNYCIKANHGSGWNIICVNGYDLVSKKKVTKSFIVNKCKEWLKRKINNKEWCYHNIKPYILIEEFLGEINTCKKLLDKSNNTNMDTVNKKTQILLPKDYKFFVFHGKVKFIQVDSGRYKNHRRDIYDINWKKMNLRYHYESSDKIIKKPINFSEMISIAEKLSNNIDFVRVDLFNLNGVIYFSEFTNYPEAGTKVFTPNKYNNIIGGYIEYFDGY